MIGELSTDGQLTGAILQEIVKQLDVPVVMEPTLHTWVQNQVIKEKIAYRGAMVILDGRDVGVPFGHIGFLAHRNMHRGCFEKLYQATFSVWNKSKPKGESSLPVPNQITRLKPKAELKVKPQMQKEKQPKEKKKPKASVFKMIRSYVLGTQRQTQDF